MLEGESTIDLPVGLDEAYATVAAVDAYPSWQSLVDHVDVLDRDDEGRPLLVSTALDAGIATLRLVLRYSYEPPHEVRWTLERGDVRDVHGSWRLQGDESATRATYQLAVDPGRRLGLLVRGGVADRLRTKVVDGTAADLAAHLKR